MVPSSSASPANNSHNNNNNNSETATMMECALPSSSPTSIVDAVAARRAAQRAYLRQMSSNSVRAPSAAATQPSTAAAAAAAAAAARPHHQWLSTEPIQWALDEELQAPPPPVPLTDLLPYMQLPISRVPTTRTGTANATTVFTRGGAGLRRPGRDGRITNEDIIAALDEVLSLVDVTMADVARAEEETRNRSNTV